MQSQIKDTFMSELGGILGSDPLPCILSAEIFSLWRMELELRLMPCLDKEGNAIGFHIHTIDSLNLCSTLVSGSFSYY